MVVAVVVVLVGVVVAGTCPSGSGSDSGIGGLDGACGGGQGGRDNTRRLAPGSAKTAPEMDE